MRGVEHPELTPREFAIQAHEKEMYELQVQHEQTIKRMELEITRLDTKWSSWLRIPITLIKLPVYCLLAVGYIVTAFRDDNEPSVPFWDLMRK